MKDREFFNSVAEEWDNMAKHPAEKVNYIMHKVNLQKGYSVLDIGSGTGVMIPHIEEKVGEEGRVTALDIAENMLRVSQRKHTYDNLKFINDDFLEFTSLEKYHAIIAYSCYPHFKDKEKFFKKAYELLRAEGILVIAHIESKDAINNRHRGIEEKIKSHMLPPVEELCEFIEGFNFNKIYMKDNEDYYIYIGKKIEE